MRYTFVLEFNVDEHELNKIRFLVKANRHDQKKSRLSENCMQHRINRNEVRLSAKILEDDYLLTNQSQNSRREERKRNSTLTARTVNNSVVTAI